MSEERTEKKHLNSSIVFNGVRVVQFLIYCVVFYRSLLFCSFSLIFVFSTFLQFTASDYPISIFKLYLHFFLSNGVIRVKRNFQPYLSYINCASPTPNINTPKERGRFKLRFIQCVFSFIILFDLYHMVNLFRSLSYSQAIKIFIIWSIYLDLYHIVKLLRSLSYGQSI